MVIAFLDESEQREVGVFAVAGYIFAPDNCRHFEEGWRQTLESVRPPLDELHMSDFENRQGPFHDWTNEYRIDFLKRLIGVIHLTAMYQIGIAVDSRALAALSREDRLILGSRRAEATPFSVAVLEFLTLSGKMVTNAESIAFVLDEASGRERVTEEFAFYNENREFAHRELGINLHSFTWASSALTPPLQAADILAYEYAKESARINRRSQRTMRKSYDVLAKGFPEDRYAQRQIGAKKLRYYVDVTRGVEQLRAGLRG